MKKFFFLAALGLSTMVQAAELDYYTTLVDVQKDATKGTTQLYNLEYAADGSLYLSCMYQTVDTSEVGLLFEGNRYKGATASKWGSKAGEMKYTNMRNSFLAKLDAEGNLLWAKADTTGDYDLSNTTIAVTNDGGLIYADKFRTRKGVYMSFFNMYNAAGQLVASNNMSFTNYDSILVDNKKVARKEAYSWAGAAQDENGYIYIAGLQGDTLLPTWNDSIAPRKAWNTKGSLSANCNTVILKYKPEYNQFQDLTYVKAVINNDELVYDRPLGLHYEGGKLYVAGTYKKGTESGIYAACYNTNLERQFIQYHAVNGSLQFQQTKFEDGKIFVCGGLAKNGSITIGDKVVPASTTAANSGFVYVINQANGEALDAAVNVPEANPLNITVAAYPTDSGYVAYNHETLNGFQMSLHYDKNLNLVRVDTIGQGGGSSTISVVGHSAANNKTAIGLRARSTAPYELQDEEPMQFTTTNWYSVVAVISTKEQPTAVENIRTDTDKAVKFIQNGQLYIKYKGVMYNVQGVVVEK